MPAPTKLTPSLIGIGLYTPADAEKLSGIPRAKLVRWVRGHGVGGRRHEPLWTRQIDAGDETILGFHDLLQAKVASALIDRKFSAQNVRHAIALAANILMSDHPFAITRSRAPGSRRTARLCCYSLFSRAKTIT